MIPFQAGGGAEGGGVRAAARLGQGEGAEELTGGEAGEPRLLLGGVAELGEDDLGQPVYRDSDPVGAETRAISSSAST